MAAAAISPPGSDFGPCKEPCDHFACAEDRILASKLCTKCKRPIGYNTPFFQRENWKHLTHATCERGQE